MSEASDPTLDALMARLSEGDRSAFTQVFERLWPPTLRLCSRLLRNDADAADAAQQALSKIFERASEYSRERPALPWALAIASWECRTLLKKRVRRREVPADSEPNLGFGNEHDHEHEHVQRQLVDAALAALGTLSDTDRETLLATFLEEAASTTGATLRKRRERALGRLRAAFKRSYGLD